MFVLEIEGVKLITRADMDKLESLRVKGYFQLQALIENNKVGYLLDTDKLRVIYISMAANLVDSFVKPDPTAYDTNLKNPTEVVNRLLVGLLRVVDAINLVVPIDATLTAKYVRGFLNSALSSLMPSFNNLTYPLAEHPLHRYLSAKDFSLVEENFELYREAGEATRSMSFVL